MLVFREGVHTPHQGGKNIPETACNPRPAIPPGTSWGRLFPETLQNNKSHITRQIKKIAETNISPENGMVGILSRFLLGGPTKGLFSVAFAVGFRGPRQRFFSFSTRFSSPLLHPSSPSAPLLPSSRPKAVVWNCWMVILSPNISGT